MRFVREKEEEKRERQQCVTMRSAFSLPNLICRSLTAVPDSMAAFPFAFQSFLLFIVILIFFSLIFLCTFPFPSSAIKFKYEEVT